MFSSPSGSIVNHMNNNYNSSAGGGGNPLYGYNGVNGQGAPTSAAEQAFY
jgi:hypothetical protein